MRLSTSVFDHLSASAAIVLLLAGMAAYFLLLEGFARAVLPRVSENQHRIAQDRKAAQALQPLTASGARSVLVVGNSLLLHGVERHEFSASMGADYQVALYPIEGTTYLDWAYGLRRLFAEGSRPAVVVLCISAKQLLSDDTGGEGFAHSLMQLRDIGAVMRDSHLNLMTGSAYFFANSSAWLGTRTAFRDGLLQKWLPGADLLAAHLAVRQVVPHVDNETQIAPMVQRLQSLRTLAGKYHAQFIYLMPPTLYRYEVSQALVVAARALHISVLIPYEPGELPDAAFSDGFHLNAVGADLYTRRAAAALREDLAASKSARAKSGDAAGCSPAAREGGTALTPGRRAASTSAGDVASACRNLTLEARRRPRRRCS